MVSAEAAADQRQPRERDARVKAAAWAWYQRHGGSIAAGSGRSEAFATRCSARPAPSRFQREATMQARIRASTRRASSDAAIISSSSMDKFSGSSSSLSHCTFDNMYGDAMDRDDMTLNDSILHEDQEIDADQPSLDLVPMDPAACWDCGSSLFDSFELVAMSKKLDAALHEPNTDGHEQAATGISLGFDLNNHQKVLSLCDTPHNDEESPPSSPPFAETHDAYNTFDKLVSSSNRQSKQAVYDMFCHYGDAAKHVTNQTAACTRTPLADATCGGDQTRKHKLKHVRMSFHGLAKALHSIKHLSSHNSHGSGDGGGDGAESVLDHHHHHHHHLHHNNPPHSQASGGKLMQSPGMSPAGAEHLAYDDVIEGPPQHKSKHIHHHHHHHYHYLFHSDDEFRLQPLDKSLMVAAAGLRSSKSNVPALSSYLGSPARGDFPGDFGRKWTEFGSMPSPNFQY